MLHGDTIKKEKEKQGMENLKKICDYDIRVRPHRKVSFLVKLGRSEKASCLSPWFCERTL